jgi:hypothetical protein
MSAAEIIEQIKALPPDARREVVDFVKSADEEARAGGAVRYADDKSFEAVADRVFEKHAELFKKLAE